MIRTAPRSILVLVVLLYSTFTLGVAQEKKTTVKKAPIQHTSPASGAEMFKSYCAACHGKDAKGAGPASVDLKTTPPDLTTLAKRHDGKFPEEYVTSVLRNGIKAPAHGTSEMPVWGPILASVSGNDQTVINMRISNLVRYLESLQVKIDEPANRVLHRGGEVCVIQKFCARVVFRSGRHALVSYLDRYLD